MNHLSGAIPQQLSNISVMTNPDFTRSRPTRIGPSHSQSDEVYLVEKGHELAYKYVDLWTDTVIDLSANNLTGEIPKDLGYLRGLRTLNISHNHLSGEIPKEFSDLLDLETLDISSNQLQGIIPAGLAGLTFLSSLNLSKNNLSGRIPFNRHWDTFGPASFSGNPNLCGPPLQRSCGDHASEAGNYSSAQSEYWWESWKAGMGFGCAIGFGSVIGVLALSTRLRMKYFQVGDKFMNSLNSPKSN